MMLDLYFRPMACSLASRIALSEAQIEARYIEVDLAAKRVVDSGGDFFAISSMGKVPVLVKEDGARLTENAAVLQYIADLAPESGLAPAPDHSERYVLQQWLSFIGTEIHKGALFLIFSPDAPEAAKDFARARAQKALAITAAVLATSAHLLGERFTVADAYLVWALTLLRFARIELDEANDDYLNRMQERPAVKAALAEERRLLAL